MINNLKKIIEKGETQKVEFKRAAFDFPKDTTYTENKIYQYLKIEDLL